jgi:hypothetical protein
MKMNLEIIFKVFEDLSIKEDYLILSLFANKNEK